MILMLAPSGDMTFVGMPSGSTYVSDPNGLLYLNNNSTADQVALENVGCFTLSPFGGWGNFGFGTLASLYAADTGTLYPGITGFPQYTVASVFSDAGNSGTWYKSGTGSGGGNWTQISTTTLSGLATNITTLQSDITSINAEIATLQTVSHFAANGSVAAATTAALPTNTYSNGTAGVGATLTATSNAALASQDGVAITAGMRLLVWKEATASHNGIYTVTQVGSGSLPYILTRDTDANTPTLLGGIMVGTAGGSTYGGKTFLLPLASGAITIGTTSLSFVQTALTSFTNAFSFITTAALLGAFASGVTVADGTVAVTSGRTAKGDGGGSVFYYDASDTTSSDNGGTIRVDSGASRRWKEVSFDPTTVRANVFGAVADGATDNAAAINAALATGKNVRMTGPGVYLVTSAPLAMSTAYQELFGEGALTEISFNFGSPQDHALQFTGSTGNQRIRNLQLNGAANCTKLISIESPEVTIDGCRLINASGHVVYGEDENTGSNIYEFGLSIINQTNIYGDGVAGHYGLRFGLNAQCGKMVGGRIENCGTGIAIQNATEAMIFSGIIIENCTTYAIDMDHVSSAPLMSNIIFDGLYFEGSPVCFHLGAGEFHGIEIRNPYAYRNGSTVGSYFFWADNAHTASAGSDNIDIVNPYIELFGVGFQLDNQYSSRIRISKGCTNVTNTNFVAGTYASNLYNVRTHNSYFENVLISGSFISPTNQYVPSLNAVFEVPVRWDTHEYLDHISFYAMSIGGTNATVELHSVTVANSTPVDTIVGSVTTAGTGAYTINVGGNADPTLNYYLKVTYSGSGTYMNIFPFQFFFLG